MPKTKKKRRTLDEQIMDRLNELKVPHEFFNIERSTLFFDCAFILMVQDVGDGNIVVNLGNPLTGKWMI